MTSRKKVTIVTVVTLLCIATTGTNRVHAENTPEVITQAKLNSTLHGNYAFTAWRSCVQTPIAPGFDRNTHALLIDGESMNFVESGIVSFNGDGTLKAGDVRVTKIGAPLMNTVPVQPGFRSSCKGTYGVHADRSCTIEMTCSAQLPGYGGGGVLTMEPFHYDGIIDMQYKAITMSESDGTIQTITLSQNGTKYTSERVCASSGTLIQASK